MSASVRFPLLRRGARMITRWTSGLNSPTGDEGQIRTFESHKIIGGDCYVHIICDGEAFEIAVMEGIDHKRDLSSLTVCCY